MPIITIDANIGAGKTTLLEKLHKDHKFLISLEPVEQWKPYLKDIYENDTGYYKLQATVWNSKGWVQKNTENIMFMERSPHFIRNTFVELLHNNGKLNMEEYNDIVSMYSTTDLIWKPDKYIYLRVSPEICFERINKRNRESEDNITIEYIKQLHEYHENVYEQARKKGYDIICIDGEKQTDEIIKEIIDNI